MSGKAELQEEITRAVKGWADLAERMNKPVRWYQHMTTPVVWWVFTVGLLWLVGVDAVWSARVGTACALLMYVGLLTVGWIATIVMSVSVDRLLAQMRELQRIGDGDE